MENILTQRFIYASITPYRNYSKIEDRTVNLDLKKLEEDVFSFNHNKVKTFRIPKKDKKKFFFFQSDVEDDKMLLQNILKFQKTNEFHTTKESQIKRHYGNPFSSIRVTIIERTIKRKGDKVIIKLYVNTRSRNVNCIFFKKYQYTYSISLDLKKGNFTVGESNREKGKQRNKFRVNNFTALNKIIKTSLFGTAQMLDKSSRLKKEFDKTFNENIFFEKIIKNLEFDRIVHNCYHITYFENDFIKKFVELKKIKVPNGNFSIYLKNFYPTEKYLKKNDRKLIASLLDMLGIKSKLTIKILHKNPNIDIFGLYYYCKIFGENFPTYLANLKNSVFENSYTIHNNDGYDSKNKNFIIYDNYYNGNSLIEEFQIRENEKQNIIKLLNSDDNKSKQLSEQSFNTLLDHLKMIKKIRKYDDTIEMRAKTMKEFHDEHVQLTTLVSAIKKGWVIEYVYDQKTINEIELPCEKMINLGTENNPSWGIDLDKKEYLYPKILKREEEYNEEGKFMHHCVSTYVDRDNSLIVSIRTKDNSDRVTCEYDIQTGRVVQERYFCNGIPPKDFEYALAKVGERVKRLARWGTLNWKEKKEVPITINGVTVFPKSDNDMEEVMFF